MLATVRFEVTSCRDCLMCHQVYTDVWVCAHPDIRATDIEGWSTTKNKDTIKCVAKYREVDSHPEWCIIDWGTV